MRKQGSGDIINIASLAGKNSFKGGAGYSATKWALIGFGRTLMLEVRDRNIRVITVCPGSVDTSFNSPMPHSRPTPVGEQSIPTADDIAQIVLDALLMPRQVMVSEIDVRPTNPPRQGN
jgi:NADP-dependent 3-hydroxy acid dehydrogenase YdfG